MYVNKQINIQQTEGIELKANISAFFNLCSVLQVHFNFIVLSFCLLHGYLLLLFPFL